MDQVSLIRVRDQRIEAALEELGRVEVRDDEVVEVLLRRRGIPVVERSPDSREKRARDAGRIVEGNGDGVAFAQRGATLR